MAALDEMSAEMGQVCDLLLENAAGAGGTVGRTFAELAEIIAATGGDERVGVCLDTQHPLPPCPREGRPPAPGPA